ncbi:MAG: tripartite tricarboxylate transporter permease [Proteobacteria bacterium]|nr:tripartite tricarboxylate transporter permease [Pseudomonadota bacterium]
METLHLLAGGIAGALQPTNLLFAFLGCVIGTIVGILPGIGPVAGTAILIPLTASLDPTAAIIMLSAIYYGAMYGGTLTSVLVNVPGEAASAITCLDGYAMAKQGRAGAALTIAAIGSFIGGSIATMGLVWLALPISSVALRFGPPEFFALMVVGLSLVTGLASTSLVRALLSATFGLMVAMVGVDPVVGGQRFTFGQVDLLDGINVVSVAMGLFGIGEILLIAETKAVQVLDAKIRTLMPTKQDWQDSWAPILRGTGIGFFIGLIPGIGAVVPTIISYVAEKRLSRTPEKFGTGMIAGVAGPETANNAYSNASLVPLFTLGIPGSPTVAIIMGAFMMNGLVPGPLLFQEHSDLVWTVIASLFVGNVILVILNLPLIPLWVMILKAPQSVLCTLILAFCVLGAYTLSGSAFDIIVMALFGVLGYLFRKLDIPLAPMVLTVILGPMMEKALRQSLEISRGSFEIFFTRPISVALLGVAAVFLIASTLRLASAVRGDDSEV